MRALRDCVNGGAVSTPLWFRAPARFVPLDLAADPADRMGALMLALRDRPQAERANLAASQETMIRGMLEGGVRYAATFLVPAGGCFTIAVRPGDGRGTAGQWVLMTEEVDVDGPHPVTGQPGGYRVVQHQAVAVHPFTGEVVVATMAVEDTDCRRLFLEILGTVRFTEDHRSECE